MKPSKKLEKQIKEWEITRLKGRNKYAISNWVLPFGVILPVVMLFFTSLGSLSTGPPLKVWGLLALVFLPVLSAFGYLLGIASWKFHEQRYALWCTEKQNGILTQPGSYAYFKKYQQLIVGIISVHIFLLNLLFMIIGAFAAHFFPSINTFFSHDFGTVWFCVFFLSFIPFLNTILFVKNPLCGHPILSNADHLHSHPEAKGSYLSNSWKILRGKPYTCLVCADTYIFEKDRSGIKIIKLETEHT